MYLLSSLVRPFRAPAASLQRKGQSIRTLLLIGFGIVLAFLLVITLLANQSLQSSVDSVQSAASAQADLAEATRNMAMGIAEAQAALLSTVILTVPEDIAYQHDEMKRAFAAYNVAEARVARQIEHGGNVNAALRNPAQTVKALGVETRNILDTMADRIGDASQREVLGSFVANSMQPSFQSWQDSLRLLETARQRGAATDTSALRQHVDAARARLMVFAALALLFGVAAAAFIAARIMAPLSQAVRVAEQVAQGDLTQPIDTHRGGEVGALLTALGRMQGSLHGLVQQVQGAGSDIALASGEIARGYEDLSQRTEHTAAGLQSTTAAMRTLSVGLHRSADEARSANTLSQQTRETARQGGRSMAAVVDSIAHIHTAGQKIADITAVIDSLAFQTNILALNAAVEAARAGETGRGFAVVAGEVRTLAQRSAEAAQQIRILIEANNTSVAGGSHHVREAVSLLNTVFDGVEQVSTIVDRITTASIEQSAQTSRISTTVEQLDAMTQQNAALVEQGTAAAISLREQADALQSRIAVFQLRETEPSPSRPTHASDGMTSAVEA